MATLALETLQLVEQPIQVEQFRLGSLANPEDVREATQIIADGGIVAAQWRRSVIGLFMRADSQEAIASALAIKGDPDTNRPFSSMMFHEDLSPFIDLDLVHPELRKQVTQPSKWQRRIGSLVHVAYPLLPEANKAIPASIRSSGGDYDVIYNIDPTGNPEMSGLISSVNEAGVGFMAVTALGPHGGKEYQRIRYAVDHLRPFGEQVLLLLFHPHPVRNDVGGSLTIIDSVNARVIRDGHVPRKVIEGILEVSLDSKETKEAFYNQADFSRLINLGIEGPELATAVLEFINQPELIPVA
ncbi:hypothetical protein A2783_02150 [Microgenomates group bacterium RIFCSPHIGHO2_01_FULL_45_11]|nr:MAG: hypothetical protein A2783_02150 [Microgenomates group bacterium RIFCSPHIGHO2_01_FULL_45_11]